MLSTSSSLKYSRILLPIFSTLFFLDHQFLPLFILIPNVSVYPLLILYPPLLFSFPEFLSEHNPSKHMLILGFSLLLSLIFALAYFSCVSIPSFHWYFYQLVLNTICFAISIGHFSILILFSLTFNWVITLPLLKSSPPLVLRTSHSHNLPPTFLATSTQPPFLTPPLLPAFQTLPFLRAQSKDISSLSWKLLFYSQQVKVDINAKIPTFMPTNSSIWLSSWELSLSCIHIKLNMSKVELFILKQITLLSIPVHLATQAWN